MAFDKFKKQLFSSSPERARSSRINPTYMEIGNCSIYIEGDEINSTVSEEETLTSTGIKNTLEICFE